jgi:hypothetical protein
LVRDDGQHRPNMKPNITGDETVPIDAAGDESRLMF